MSKILLKIGGYTNILIGVAHLVGLFWVDKMFAITGIGKEMQELGSIHISLPYIMTIFVALVFILFGLYAFSALGIYRKLPFLQIGLLIIAIIYLIRGIGALFINNPNSTASSQMEIVYALVAIFIGFCYLIGWKHFKN